MGDRVSDDVHIPEHFQAQMVLNLPEDVPELIVGVHLPGRTGVEVCEIDTDADPLGLLCQPDELVQGTELGSLPRGFR